MYRGCVDVCRNLSNNALTLMNKAMFASLGNLQVLRLSNNRIAHIDVDTFSDMSSLVEL